jgi:hypothetical protein
MKGVQRVNVCVAKCAEDLILCSGESQYVRDLASTYSRFRVESESTRLRTSRGFIIGNRTRSVECK